MLAFDVDSQSPYEFAGHGLGPQESFFSTPKIADVVTNVRDFTNNEPDARWSEFRTWISQQDAHAYELSLLNTYMNSGAGQMRQWGRLGVLLQPELFDRIRDVVRELAASGSVPVYVVGSLCGGTGSASLFDVAGWIHAIQHQAAPGVPMRIVGIFLLPAGFTADVNAGKGPWLEACSYAALPGARPVPAGLGHHEAVVPRHPPHSQGPPVRHLLPGRGDPGGGQVSNQEVINTRSRQAVDAAMADLIYAHLHPVSAGSIGSSDSNVVTQLAGRHTHKYSKFGVFSLISPSRLIVRSLALDGAAEVVSALSARDDVAKGTTLLSTSEVRFSAPDGADRKAHNARVLLAAARYLGDGAKAPRGSEVLEWLTGPPGLAAPAPPTTGLRPEVPRGGQAPQRLPEPAGAGRRQPALDGAPRRGAGLGGREQLFVLASFRSYLLVQCARLAGEPSGLARAGSGLAEVTATIRRLRTRFDELSEQAGAGRLEQTHRRYHDARDALDRKPSAHSATPQRGALRDRGQGARCAGQRRHQGCARPLDGGDGHGRRGCRGGGPALAGARGGDDRGDRPRPPRTSTASGSSSPTCLSVSWCCPGAQSSSGSAIGRWPAEARPHRPTAPRRRARSPGSWSTGWVGRSPSTATVKPSPSRSLPAGQPGRQAR